MDIDSGDRELLAGQRGPAMKLAMEIVLQAGRIMGAPHLVPVTFAHLDACFYNGQAHVDFAQYCLDHGATFAVPTWGNGLPWLAVRCVPARLRPNPRRAAWPRSTKSPST